MTRHILIAEDQVDIAELVSLHLKDLGFRVTVVHDGRKALELVAHEHFDGLVLDVMLPGLDGFSVVRQLRMEKRAIPVLMLTARSTEIDRVLGLELGADDYLTKPFSIPELQARVKAMLRRAEMASTRALDNDSTGTKDQKIAILELSIDPASRVVRLNEEVLPLTSKEYDLLLHFAKAPGRVFTRSQLLEAVWGTTFEGYEHNVNTHINRLRSKLEKDPTNPRYVLTVRGVGYRFVNPKGD